MSRPFKTQLEADQEAERLMALLPGFKPQFVGPVGEIYVNVALGSLEVSQSRSGYEALFRQPTGQYKYGSTASSPYQAINDSLSKLRTELNELTLMEHDALSAFNERNCQWPK